MDGDTNNLVKAIIKNIEYLSINLSSYFSGVCIKLDNLKESIDSLNKTINKASESSNKVAWALWGVTVAGVLIAATTLIFKYYKGY